MCRTCGKWFRNPQWVALDLESSGLLALCVRRIRGLKGLKLEDASWIWTEPHSRRLKLKLTVSKEVMSGQILQQSFIVECAHVPCASPHLSATALRLCLRRTLMRCLHRRGQDPQLRPLQQGSNEAGHMAGQGSASAARRASADPARARASDAAAPYGGFSSRCTPPHAAHTAPTVRPELPPHVPPRPPEALQQSRRSPSVHLSAPIPIGIPAPVHIEVA